jgi:hypothetical protein
MIAKPPIDLSSYTKVSVNTIRTKVGGTEAARKLLKVAGFVSEDNFNYTKTEETLLSRDSFKPAGETKRLIITSYLIGSKVNNKIWKSITDLKTKLSAQLVVIAHRYKNPTNLQESLRQTEGSDYIDPRVENYLCWEDFHYGGHDVLASIQVNCTTLNPLVQIKKFAINHSINGHSTQSLLVKPTLAGKMPPVIWSTGTISDIEEASNLKAKQAQFHYKYGCVIVSPMRSSRNIDFSKTGNFSDIDAGVYENEQFTAKAKEDYKAVIWGDSHHGSTCPDTFKWQLNVTKQLNPAKLYLHDFIDAATVNPHASKLERSRYFNGNLHEEFESCAKQLNHIIACIKDEGGQTTINLVRSNHPDMVSRHFLANTIQDLSESELLIFALWLQNNKSPEAVLKLLCDSKTYLKVQIVDEYSPEDAKISLNNHGDKGVNGSRLSASQLFNNGFIGVVGHGHSPFILGGANGVGTSTYLDLGYNKYGASSWCQSIATVNKFDKIQHLIRFSSY